MQECLAQLDRTAQWLSSVPLARFASGLPAGSLSQSLQNAPPETLALRDQARKLITTVHELVQQLCSDGGADCPPADSLPDRLGDHALGHQLAVHSADLGRVLHSLSRHPGDQCLVQIAAAGDTARGLRVAYSNPLAM